LDAWDGRQSCLEPQLGGHQLGCLAGELLQLSQEPLQVRENDPSPIDQPADLAGVHPQHGFWSPPEPAADCFQRVHGVRIEAVRLGGDAIKRHSKLVMPRCQVPDSRVHVGPGAGEACARGALPESAACHLNGLGSAIVLSGPEYTGGAPMGVRQASDSAWIPCQPGRIAELEDTGVRIVERRNQPLEFGDTRDADHGASREELPSSAAR
jgi:hypothetical protein